MVICLPPASLDAATATPRPTRTIQATTTQAPTDTPKAEDSVTPTVEATTSPTPENEQENTADSEGTVTATPKAEGTVTATSTPADKPVQEITSTTGLELTVYNQNLALVKDTRPFELKDGLNELRFDDVAALIDPTSVQVTSLSVPTETRVLEQNFEYDLVDTFKLVSKYIDKEISVRTSHGEIYTGTLLSGNGDVILQLQDGIKIIKESQILEYTFPKLPTGLITRPSLNWLVTTTAPGPQDLRLTYLTGGLSWRASYVLLLAPRGDQVDLNGWITLQNDSGTSYQDARLKLVAGDVNLVQQLAPVPARAAMEYAAEEKEGVASRSFFEYHLYEIQRPVTVRESEIKQVEFIAAPSVATEKVFVYEATPRYYSDGLYIDAGDYTNPDTKVQVRLQFSNTITNGLGMPLPMGIVRVYQQDSDGSAEFVGEDAIEHTPKDEALSLYLGNAFDLVAERKQVEYRQLSERSAEESWEMTLRNHKTEAVVVQVIEDLFRAEDAEVRESSLEYTELGNNRIRFDVPIKPDEEVKLTYTVLYRW